MSLSLALSLALSLVLSLSVFLYLSIFSSLSSIIILTVETSVDQAVGLDIQKSKTKQEEAVKQEKSTSFSVPHPEITYSNVIYLCTHHIHTLQYHAFIHGF